MNSKSSLFKMTAFMALNLTTCPPAAYCQLVEMPNGLTFERKNTETPYSVVDMQFFHPVSANDDALLLLTHEAAFQVSEELQHLGFDLSPLPLLKNNERGHSVRLPLSSHESQDMDHALKAFRQALFKSNLEISAIEAARLRLVNHFEETDSSLGEEIATLTYEEVQAYYQKWMRPSLIHLTIETNTETDEKSTAALFGEAGSQEADDADLKLAEQMHKEVNETSFELNPDHLLNIHYNQNHSVIDGKIWIDNPNWINKSSNGHALGAFLTATGIGSFVLAIPLAPVLMPAIAAAATVSTVTGIYFLSCDYLKDPNYLYEKRQEDLVKGFQHAYRGSRSDKTLTPYERRPLFLQEMVNGGSIPSIVLLADLYDLSLRQFSEILTIEEMAFLVQSKLYFIQYRNHYQKLIDKLDKELLNLTAPYAQMRDNKLTNANSIYNQNVFVCQKNHWKTQLDENIAQIQEAYEKEQISLEDKKELIKEHETAYQNSLNEISFAAGLSQAEGVLAQMKNDILLTYDLQVSQCKQAIQYDQRRSEFKFGKNSLIYECDSALRDGLATFPLLLDLPDFVDLRTPLN
ncbi:MAG: hypothetical protein LW832_09635 [Parachlamydia sp.]|jgi:hypothetical protein|nr:hypothetical protein [Parachlamydia sp.]